MKAPLLLNAKEPKTPLAIIRNTFRGSFAICKEYIAIAANPSSVPTARLVMNVNFNTFLIPFISNKFDVVNLAVTGYICLECVCLAPTR